VINLVLHLIPNFLIKDLLPWVVCLAVHPSILTTQLKGQNYTELYPPLHNLQQSHGHTRSGSKNKRSTPPLSPFLSLSSLTSNLFIDINPESCRLKNERDKAKNPADMTEKNKKGKKKNV